MTRYVVTIGIVVLIAAVTVLWFAHREAVALDREAAAEIEAIRARAEGEPVVIVEPGPVRVVERERVVVQRVAPGAQAVASATVETSTTATGAPVLVYPETQPGPCPPVECPSPELGCRTEITGWRTDLGNVVATGTQTLRWKWPGEDWRESATDLTPANTTITTLPMVLQPDRAPRWIAGFSVGLDGNADKRASVYGLRRIAVIRDRALYASAAGMVGGGDVVVTAGLAAGW